MTERLHYFDLRGTRQQLASSRIGLCLGEGRAGDEMKPGVNSLASLYHRQARFLDQLSYLSMLTLIDIRVPKVGTKGRNVKRRSIPNMFL